MICLQLQEHQFLIVMLHSALDSQLMHCDSKRGPGYLLNLIPLLMCSIFWPLPGLKLIFKIMMYAKLCEDGILPLSASYGIFI